MIITPEEVENLRTRIGRIGSTDPVAICRRLRRLGYDGTDEEVAFAISAIENVRVDVAPAPEPAKAAPKKKTTTRKRKAAPKKEEG